MKKYDLLYAVVALGCSWSTQGFSANLQTLLPDERNTVEVFAKSSPKVVFVHRLATVRNRYLRKKQVPDGAGTGIIWNKQGYVVTNYHVIKGADTLEITVNDKTVPAKVVGKDARVDLAVLKLQGSMPALANYQPFKAVRLQDLVVGQKAIAIGNPYGLDHSLSKGVISALGRDVPGAGGVIMPHMIQTDTSINPGNSGGPLLNSAGELLGINTIIFSRTGASSGIGFAMPAEDVEHFVGQLIKNGKIVLPGLGIHQVDPKRASRLGVPHGILIADILPNSPAAHAKLRATHKDRHGRTVKGDVIVALNAFQVNDYNDLYAILSKTKVGEPITVSIQRNKKQMDITMHTVDVSTLPVPKGHGAGFYQTSMQK